MTSAGHRRGIPFVVAAPSGTGKTTVCRLVLERLDGIEFSVSHTTRPKRDNEVDGRDYFFVDRAEFQRMIEQGAFLEHAVYNDNHYGTSWRAIEGPISEGRDMLLEIEVQGAGQVRERRSDARLIFLLPPSRESLRERLAGRGTDSDEQIARRLRAAEDELRAVSQFDYAITNADLDHCVDDVIAVIVAEREGRTEAVRERFSAQAAEERFEKAREGGAVGRSPARSIR